MIKARVIRIFPIPLSIPRQEAIAAARIRPSGLRTLSWCGFLLFLGFVGLFFLLHTHTLWESATLVQDKWKNIFYPIVNLFPQSWVRAPRGSETALYNALAYLALLAVLFGIFFFALKRAFAPGAFTQKQKAAAFTAIFLSTLGILCVLFVVPGMFSTDLYSYIWYGRIYGVYGQSPFTHYPAQYFWYDYSDWMQWVFWKTTPSVYGPVWVWIAGGIAQVAHSMDDDIVTHLLGHKLVAAVAHLVNIVLVWNVARLVIARYWRMPTLPKGVAEADWRTGMQVAVTAAYALNPLVLIEFGISAHNDILMITGIFLALWLHLTGHWRLAVLAVAAASLVKVIALLFLPGYLWLLFWQRRNDDTLPSVPRRLWTVAQAVGLLVVAWVVTYIPFWDGLQTLKPLSGGPPAEFFIQSLGSIIRWRVPEIISNVANAFGWQPASYWTANAIGIRLDFPARYGMLAIAATIALQQTWKARTFPGMIIGWGWALFAYLTIGAVWFWPWYVSWLIVPVILVGPSRLFKATQILCVTSIALYAFRNPLPPPLDWVAGWIGLFMMAPPLLYVLGSMFSDWLHRRAVQRAASQLSGPASPGEESPAVRVPLIPEPLRVPSYAAEPATQGSYATNDGYNYEEPVRSADYGS